MAIDPNTSPSEHVAKLLTMQRPHKLVDFPRWTPDGKAPVKVFIRLLTAHEEMAALANARVYMKQLLKGSLDLEWRPVEIDENARAIEVLSIACRNPDNPEKPFFELGAVEMRKHFGTDELAILWNDYRKLKEELHPLLRDDLTEKELDIWIATLKEGVAEFPFSAFTRSRLEQLLTYAVKSGTFPQLNAT